MIRTVAVWVAALLLVGCRPPSDERLNLSGTAVSPSGITATVELLAAPRVGRVPVAVTLSGDEGPVGDAQVRVVGDMTHAGMAPVVAEARESEPGRYLAEDFAFDMAGDWVLTAEVTLLDGERLAAARPVAVP